MCSFLDSSLKVENSKKAFPKWKPYQIALVLSMPFSSSRSKINSSKQMTKPTHLKWLKGILLLLLLLLLSSLCFTAVKCISAQRLQSPKKKFQLEVVTSFSLATFFSDAIWQIFVLAFMTNVNHSYTTVSLRLAKCLWLSSPCSLFMRLSITPHSWQWCVDYHRSVSDHIFQLHCRWELLIWGYQQTNCLSLTMPHEEV